MDISTSNKNQNINTESHQIANNTAYSWHDTEYLKIRQELKESGLEIIKNRPEYTLFKEIIPREIYTDDPNFRIPSETQKAVTTRPDEGSVICLYGDTNSANDTAAGCDKKQTGAKVFLAPLASTSTHTIADDIPSFSAIQSKSPSINIGFDTEFQGCPVESSKNRKLLSIQMSFIFGVSLIRYCFLISPRYQDVCAESGGHIPLKYCLCDILTDILGHYCPDLPVVNKNKIIYILKKWKNHDPYKVPDFKAMRDSIIPITLIAHAGKADFSVFRRSKYDVDIIRSLGEIEGGWMTTRDINMKAEYDSTYNQYWLIRLTIRDTLGLTPADHKSLKALGEVTGRKKIELAPGVITRMAEYAVTDPIGYYEYAMNDADIVVSFCADLFMANRKIPMTLSAAAASAMYRDIKSYLGAKNRSEYDRIYRGLELLDEGLVKAKDEDMKFLKATRYVPIRDNPDAKILSSYYEEGYTGGFNASFYIGWITDKTFDYDLKNAYPTAMACLRDIDWSLPAHDMPRDHLLTFADLPDPLIPAVAVGDFEFPAECYCPCIPVPIPGYKIYPRKASNVYMVGPDMYLAIKLGAKIVIHRGFICDVLIRDDGTHSMCLGHAVTSLVQDRSLAKKIYPDTPLVEKSLKTMANTGYGKTAQNVSPKTRYNARKQGREDAEPSVVTSPYHASYITSLVRCMLIACINQLHDRRYHVYSVTTDGFITDAPEAVLKGLDAYGFADIFQAGRYVLNQTHEDIPDNQVWEQKHYNDTFLNITTRGNVAVNEGGVLAHNSYITGEVKGSLADREAYIIAVLSREGRLKCPTKVWTQFSDIVARKYDFGVSEITRQLSMDFDYKRVPILDSAVDRSIHYTSSNGDFTVDTVIAEFDTRPFEDVEEYLNYRPAKQTEDCVKVKADLERVAVKASANFRGYIGKDLPRKQLSSIIAKHHTGDYDIPAFDGLSESELVELINTMGITSKPLKVSDIKNWRRPGRRSSVLPDEYDHTMLETIYAKTGYTGISTSKDKEGV